MWKLDALLVGALDGYNNRFTAAQSSGRRFCVRRVFGSLAKQKNGGNAKGGASRSGGSASAGSHAAIESGEIRPLKWKRDELGSPIPNVHRAIDVLALPTAAEDMVEELRRWKESEDWYRSREIPWTRGWILYGLPGTGKTSLIRAVAQDLDLPIFIYDLASLSNRELQENWETMQQSAPCIALMEDLDTVFKKRVNCSGEQGGGLSFDALLNCLSGIESADGVFKVATTNNIEDLDSALGVPSLGSTHDTISTRPGRFDRALELPALDAKGRLKIASRILSGYEWHIDNVTAAGIGDTGAQFVERCSQVALAAHWQMPNKPHRTGSTQTATSPLTRGMAKMSYVA